MGDYLDIWFTVTSLVFIVSLLSALFVGVWRKNIKALILLSGVAAISIVLFLSQKYQIRKILAEELSVSSFVVEAHEEFEESKLLDSLRSSNYVTMNRTKPLSKSKVRIVINSGEVELLIAQDSKNEDLFWIYYPKYRFSRLNPVGKVRIR